MKGILLLHIAIAFLVLSCGGGVERIATEIEPAGDLFVHSPRAPRVTLEQAVRNDRMPDVRGDALFWTAKLPFGSDEARRPAILVATAPDGGLLERVLWVDRLGMGDFRSADPVPLEPDKEDEGVFWASSISIAYDVPVPSGSLEVNASFRGLLQLDSEGGRLRLFPADTRVGTFPAGGSRFLLYDEDRNGMYDLADRMVIDANADGTFDGNRNSVELYSIGEPFALGGKPYRVTEVAWDGSSIALAPSAVVPEPRVALVPGDPAPDFALTDLDGNAVRFSVASAGRPTLLSYWATW